MDSQGDPRGGLDILFGLPEKEVTKVCRQRYKNEVVKVTVQIAEPEAMQLKMDVSIKPADALGIVGKYQQSNTVNNCTRLCVCHFLFSPIKPAQ